MRSSLPAFVKVLACTALISTAAMLCGANDAMAQTGTYCSAYTEDGRWAFIYGMYPVEETCAAVERSLEATGGAIVASRRGTYFAGDLNRVVVRCFANWNRLSGYGTVALESAYRWAAYGRRTGCLFAVNNW